MLSFVQKLVDSNGKYIFYVKATDKIGLRAWYFVQVKPDKLNAFKALAKSQSYTMSDYGKILESGYGDFAPADIVAKINAKYKCIFAA